MKDPALQKIIVVAKKIILQLNEYFKKQIIMMLKMLSMSSSPSSIFTFLVLFCWTKGSFFCAYCESFVAASSAPTRTRRTRAVSPSRTTSTSVVDALSSTRSTSSADEVSSASSTSSFDKVEETAAAGAAALHQNYVVDSPKYIKFN